MLSYILFSVLVVKPRASHMLNKGYTTMPCPRSLPSLGILIVRESPSGEIAKSEECASSN